MAKKRAKKRVKRAAKTSPEEFIKAWRKGGTPQEVAERLGVGVRAIHNRGSQYRARGVKLPKLTDGRIGKHKLDVAALNKLVRG